MFAKFASNQNNSSLRYVKVKFLSKKKTKIKSLSLACVILFGDTPRHYQDGSGSITPTAILSPPVLHFVT